MPDPSKPFRQGFASSLTDRVNRARLSANPYDIVAGTPDQQAKLTSLFPGADSFMRRRSLEQDYVADRARGEWRLSHSGKTSR